MTHGSGVLHEVLTSIAGPERTGFLLSVLEVHPPLLDAAGPAVPRAVLAQALNMLLFEDLLRRVPAAAAYVDDCLRDGTKVFHDHGAVRTVAMSGMGALPPGEEAIVRLLRPLGYALHGVYPLERLRMTGRSYAQAEYPQQIAQFFISELHPDRFSPEFQQAVARVTGSSRDPITPEAHRLLLTLEAAQELSIPDAVKLLPVLAACFDRQHTVPGRSDYEALLAESPEMAWIATEGNAFNHATDRVADVDQVAAEQKRLGRPMKEKVETSQSGRVRQTAFLASRVRRSFKTDGATEVEMEVPGSFYELITRLPLPEKEELDLGFDSSNAQAIFKMTGAAK
ncbi:MAG TPA: DUF1338 domain-containing protein [Acidisarcina sp.]